MCYTWGRGEINARFWWENLKEQSLLEDLHLERTGALKWFLKKQDGRAWTKLTGLRILTPVVSSCENEKEP
jgi:hypothetical protein